MATARTRVRSLAALVLVALCITCTEAFGPRPRPRLYSKVRLEQATPLISFPTDRARKRERGAERARVEPRRTESPSSQVSDTRIAHRRPILIAALAPAPARGGARAPRACARRARGRGPAHGREMARVSGPGLQGSLGRGNERGRRFLRPGRGRARAWTRAADGILRFWFCFFSRRRRDFFVAAVAPGLVSEGRREGEASAQRREVRGVLFAAPAPRAARVGDARGVL